MMPEDNKDSKRSAVLLLTEAHTTAYLHVRITGSTSADIQNVAR